MYGKSIRLSRLIHLESKKFCIVPLDHGVTLGPIDGIKNGIQTVDKMISGGADAVVVHKGLLREISNNQELASKGHYIMHLSASTVLGATPNYKVIVGSVEEAIKLGADGVSIQVNLGTLNDQDMLKDFGMISKSCLEWGMPLIAMMYSYKSIKDTSEILHCARIAEELGADIVKIGCPDTIEEIQEIVDSVNIPIVIAGGTKIDDPVRVLNMVYEALLYGAAGVAIGRNVFQYENPKLILSLISKLTHNEMRLQDCLYSLKEEECRIY